MDKKLPGISKFSTSKKISNNKNAYYSFVEQDKDVRSGNNERDNFIKKEETLDDLFNNGQYIFNIPVKIKTKDKIVSSNIVAKVNDHIITSDSDIIEIKDIENIVVD